MPAPFATPARETWQALRRNFGDTPVVLSAAGYLSTLEALVTCGVAGGRVYDALVAATAAEVGARLLYADVRAIPTYALVGAEAQIVRPGGEPPA